MGSRSKIQITPLRDIPYRCRVWTGVRAGAIGPGPHVRGRDLPAMATNYRSSSSSDLELTTPAEGALVAPMPDKDDLGSSELHETIRGGGRGLIRRVRPEDMALYPDFLG